jgi:hypothetical protein
MGMFDLFRPKHRHSDVKVRVAAVRALSSDDTQLLASIARTDKDPGVRRIAIEKLEEVDILADIFERESDGELRDLAGSRAAELWVTSACQDEDEALARSALSGLIKVNDQRALAEVATRAGIHELRGLAMAELRDARALAEVARSSSSPELRQKALARIDDQATLRGLAVDTTVKDFGLAIVDRMTSTELLEVVAVKAKNKAVRQRARKKIDELHAVDVAPVAKVPDALLRRRAEKAQVLRSVEALADHVEWIQSLETVRGAEKAWAALGDTEEPQIDERFRRALTRYHGLRDAALRAQQEREAEILATAAARRAAEEKAATERAERAAARRAKGDDDEDEGDIVNQAAMAVLRPGPLTDEQKAEREAEATKRREAQTKRRAEDQTRRAEEAAARAAREHELAERNANLARSLGALIDEMASLIASTDVKAIDRLLGQSATAFGQLGRVPAAERDGLETRYREVRGQLVGKLQELREGEDWKRWANVPRAEHLVAAAKELAEREEQPTLDILKELQRLWKEIGPLPQKKSQELWEQFKTHADAAFVRIRAVRDVDRAKMADHAAAREALIAEAEGLAESTDWEATAAALKELQAKWKTAGPVPRKQGDELWKRFRAACDKFFERRKPLLDAQHAELEVNLAAKQRLIERAHAIVAKAPGERGWGADIGAIKDLQAEWKEIGHVPRAEVERLWQQFRAACDGLFAKRDAARDAEGNARRNELDGLRAELTAITAAATAGDAESVGRAIATRRQFVELRQRDGQLGAELNAALEEMLRAVVVHQAAALRGTELDPATMASKRSKLIGRASDLVPHDHPTVEAGAPAATIAEQLKAAMSQNALFKGDGRNPLEVLEEIEAEWIAVGPVIGRDAERQAERFAEVCDECRYVFGGETGERRSRGDRRSEKRARPERRQGEGDGGTTEEAAPAAAAPATVPMTKPVAAPAPATVPMTKPVAAPAPAAVAKPVEAAKPAPAPVAKPVEAAKPAPAPVAKPVEAAKPAPAPAPAPAPTPVEAAKPAPAPAPVEAAKPAPAPVEPTAAASVTGALAQLVDSVDDDWGDPDAGEAPPSAAATAAANALVSAAAAKVSSAPTVPAAAPVDVDATAPASPAATDAPLDDGWE